MKKILATLLIPLALTACAKSTPTPAPAPTVTVTAEKTLELPSTPVQTNSEYLAVLREADPSIDEKTAMQLGEATCRAFNDGTTVRELFEMGLSTGVNLDVLGQQIAASAIYLCPEHKASVEKQFESLM